MAQQSALADKTRREYIEIQDIAKIAGTPNSKGDAQRKWLRHPAY
jgi:hypothetical protein